MIARIVDLETTGQAPPAQVCEVGWCDLDVESGLISVPMSSLCRIEGDMPPEARAVHHISAADCAEALPFDQADIFNRQPCTVLVAHNAAFELQWITPPVPVICTYKAALRVWPDAPGHGNNVLRYWLEDQHLISPKHALTVPTHRAGPDAYVTAHIMSALLRAGVTGREMVAWTKEPTLLPRCPIGKHRGKRWSEVESGFLSWMQGVVDMDADLKWNAWRELERRREAA